MGFGLILLAFGYLWIAWGVNNVATKVSIIWLTGMYLLHTWGELCLSPIGLSLFNKLSPQGVSLVEGHENHLEALGALALNLGFSEVIVIKDYTNRDRFLRLKK